MVGCKFAFAIVLTGLLAGCGASFVGSKLPPSGALSNLPERGGIPFMLSRPSYKVAVTPDPTDNTKAQFALSVQYVPDSTQMYSIRFDPAIFAESSFKFTFHESMPGVLAGVGADVKEQVTPTIKSIGTFTASVIGLVTTATLDPTSEKPVLAGVLDTVRAKCLPDVATQIVADVHQFVPTTVSSMASDESFVSDVVAWGAAETPMRTLYHYKTPEQRNCLAIVARSYQSEEVTAINREKKVLLCSLPGLPSERMEKLKCSIDGDFGDGGNNPDPVADDSDEFRLAIIQALSASDELRLTGLLQQTVREFAIPDIGEKRRSILRRRQATLAEAIEISKRPTEGRTDLVKFLEFFVVMPDNVWRARHVLHLRNMRGACIAEAFQGSSGRCSQPATTGNISQVLAAIDRQISVTAAEGSRYNRILKLREFLAYVRDRDVQGGKAPAATEYVTMRAEYDSLSSAYTAAVDAVVARNEIAPGLATEADGKVNSSEPRSASFDSVGRRGGKTVVARDSFDVGIADWSFIRDSQRPGWLPNGHPEFVIVVEPYVARPVLTTVEEAQQ